jgi:MoaA/NifB/PqqE/SkfB family radical SAM enzyme
MRPLIFSSPPDPALMLLGFALTQHCNLRCPHCIRDDVTTPLWLEPALVRRVVSDARSLFGDVRVSLTGGEPTIHPQWDEIVDGFAADAVSYRFVSNGWHMRRLMPSLDRYAPAHVRLSLSGGTAEVHDADRGRGSFTRVLLAVALLTSRAIPTSLSLVIDRRSRHQLRLTADLAESLGCLGLSFILPQPVAGSVQRDSDLAPHEWAAVRREVLALAAEAGRHTPIQLDYGAPSDEGEKNCDTFTRQRIYVDAHGRLSLCCQLSEYGGGEGDVVADLRRVSLLDAWPRYLDALGAQQARSRPSPIAAERDAFDAFPCIRCARSLGKMEWIRAYPESPWSGAAERESPALVTLARA